MSVASGQQSTLTSCQFSCHLSRFTQQQLGACNAYCTSGQWQPLSRSQLSSTCHKRACPTLTHDNILSTVPYSAKQPYNSHIIASLHQTTSRALLVWGRLHGTGSMDTVSNSVTMPCNKDALETSHDAESSGESVPLGRGRQRAAKPIITETVLLAWLRST